MMMKPNDYLLTSVHTNNLPTILKQLGISLIVSTYQAGKLIVIREDDGKINTHFRNFKKPMGLAGDRHKLALGTAYQIWDFRNVPAVAAKLEPPGKHDACYLPRKIQITGNIDIHEMAWVGEELWFINTKFSCLCTLDNANSFVPRWRPNFITGYDLTDRCHLNGFCLKNGKPKYATALGETDAPQGWRQNKATGGILIDIETNEVLWRGLSMPHSPRWYGENLWLLESGNGSLVKVDLTNKKLETIVTLPGFTRGIDFWGDLAFIGLSQVRETAVFSGMPVTKLTERICGVWVVNIKTGEKLAFLRFESGVEEIFAVTVLPNIRFPEIIEWDENLLASSYVIPDEALAETIQPTLARSMAEEHLAKGDRFYHQGNLTEAIACYRESLQLQPDFLLAKYSLGVALGDKEEYPEAMAFLEEVIAQEKDNPDAYNSLGFICSELLELEKAIAYYEKAIELNGNFAKAHFNLGMTLLQKGELRRGFAECEWRWQTPQFHPFQCPQPKWDGGEIGDKTLLVHTEQGTGDAIQFVRYLPIVRNLCRRLVLVCMPDLMPLFATVEGIDKLMPPGEIDVSEFDVYLPLMSLPHVLGTTLATVPGEVPYLGKWEMGNGEWGMGNETKVGIVWGGSPTHKSDRNRSCKVTDFLPVLRVPGIRFYSLQVGVREALRMQHRAADLKQLPPEITVEDLSPHIKNYSDTAAIVSQLDLIISVDTSVAHLAGALAKPVWTLLCYNPDWRWMLEREDTPWYPTMRLFRQSQPGDWESVFRRVQRELLEFAAR